MLQELLFNIICTFIGTMGLALIYNVPKNYLVGCGFTGMLGWMGYYIVVHAVGGSPSLASFVGAFVVALTSRIMAVIMKCPMTIFLISGIVPLVPGASVYQMVYYLIIDQATVAFGFGLLAVKMAFAIVLGIIIIFSIPRNLFQRDYWKKSMKTKVEAQK